MPDTYADQYADALHPRRYSADDFALQHGHPLPRHDAAEPAEVPHNTADVIHLAEALTDEDRHPSHTLSHRRAVLADALEDAGDSDTAAVVRDPMQHIVWNGGRVQRGKFQYRDVTFHDGDDYPEAEQRLDDDGPIGAAAYLEQWDHGGAERHYFDEPQWGSSDRVHHVGLPTGTGPTAGGQIWQHYVVNHNPRIGYMGLTHVREVPHDTPSGSR